MSEVSDVTRKQLVLDIIDKLNGFKKKQCKIFIKTLSNRYYNGEIQQVYPNKIVLYDDKVGFLDIYFSEIGYPSDIKESWRK